MQVLNGAKEDNPIHAKARRFAGDRPNDAPQQHDFFAPLNAMDPHTKRPRETLVIPEFKHRVFHLAGPGAPPAENQEYSDVMNEITKGNSQLIGEDIYHSKDGDIRVFVRWLVLPVGQRMTDPPRKSDEERALELAESINAREAQKSSTVVGDGTKKKRRRKKHKKGDKKTEKPSVAACPAPPPTVAM
jgi:hypothetical protein